jgi:excisionase family DNA binding protein
VGRNEGQTLPQLLDIEAVAEHLGVSVRHVRRLVYERRIPYVKWGHLLRFDPTAIAEWLENARVESAAAVGSGTAGRSAGLR